jgi:hypothetical protein
MRKPPESLDAWAAYQRGLWHLSKATPEDDAFSSPFIAHRATPLSGIVARNGTPHPPDESNKRLVSSTCAEFS